MRPTALARFRDTFVRGGVPDLIRPWLGWTMALAATTAASTAAPVIRGAILVGMNPTTLVMMTMVITTLLLGGSIALAAPGRPRIDRRGLLVTGAAGLANGAGSITFFQALVHIDASVASMIFALNSLVVLGLLALRGERFTYRHAIRVLLGLGGVFLIIDPRGAVNWAGTLLVLTAALGAAIQLVLMQWFLQDYDARTVTFYMVVSMTAVATVWWLLEGMEWHDPGWQGWLLVGVLAVVSAYLGQLALFAGVRSLGSGQLALMVPLRALLGVIWSVLFLDERLTTWQWIGGVLIFVSTLIAGLRLRSIRQWARWRAW